MLDGIITSHVRARILMRLFVNPQSRAYLRELAKEFDASPSHIKSELEQLSEAGLLENERVGRQVHYRANRRHPLFPELQSMLRKALGMDRILDSIVERLGELELAWLVGDYARGVDSGIIDLVLVGGDIDQSNLADLTAKTERYIGRKIRTLVLTRAEFQRMENEPVFQLHLLLWRRALEDE